LNTIVLCCISTDELRFPNQRAAAIAVKTVREYQKETDSHHQGRIQGRGSFYLSKAAS
jgi:O-acetyl-ADP-ribose deacetylase (regulator of RNase III)